MVSEATIDRLQIEVSTKSKATVEGLKELKKALFSLKRIGKSTELDDLATKLEKISKIRFNNLKQLNALGETLKQVKALTKQVGDLSSKMDNMPDTIDATVDTGGIDAAKEGVGELSGAMDDVPKQATVDVDASGADVASKKVSVFRTAMEKVRGATSKASTGVKSLSARLRQVSSAFTKTTKKASQLSQILKIVVVYGGAFRAFAMLTQGVSEGLQNVARYNAETAASMSRLSTMALTLKNSIGAALYPVVVALTPALQTMTNMIVRAFEAMGQLASLLSGKTTYLKAKEYLKEYGDKAKKTANEIKKSFAGMDEITVLGDKSGSSSNNEEDYSSMFEETPINNPKLQALIPFFDGLRTVLSNCLETIKGLASDYLYPWLVDLGNWCAENPDTLESIGEGLGKIAVALVAMKGASAVITPLANFFKSVGGAKNGVGILGTVAGAIVQLMGAFDAWENGMTWENLGKQLGGIGAAIGALAISVGHIGAGIASIIGGIVLTVTSVKDWLENGVSWKNFLGVMIGLAAVFGGISLLVGSWIPMAIGAVVASIAAIIMWWEEISGFFVNLWNTIIGFFVSIGTAIGEFFGGIATWVYDNILQPIILFFQPFVEALCGFFEIIWHSISSVFTAIYEVVSHYIGAVIEGFAGLGRAIWAVITKIYEIVSTLFEIMWAVISRVFTLIGEKMKPVIAFVGDLAAKIVEKLTAVVDKVKTKVIDPVVNFFKEMIDKIVGFFKNVGITIVDGLSGLFKSVMNGVFTIVEGVVNFFIGGINRAVDIINKIPGVEISKIEVLEIPRFATGGFPEDGVFMANHNELVGKFSNGKTAVANNEQIVAGISDGVYAANQEQNGLLREQNRLLRQLVENESNGSIDVTTITSAMRRKNRRDGKTIVPVGI